MKNRGFELSNKVFLPLLTHTAQITKEKIKMRNALRITLIFLLLTLSMTQFRNRTTGTEKHHHQPDHRDALCRLFYEVRRGR